MARRYRKNVHGRIRRFAPADAKIHADHDTKRSFRVGASVLPAFRRHGADRPNRVSAQRRPAPSPRRPTSMASRSWIITASSTLISWIIKNPEYKAPWNQIWNSRAPLHASGQGDPNAQLRHALLHGRRGPACRTHRAHRARRWRRIAISASSSSTTTPLTSTTSAPARPATEAGRFCSPGRDGKARHPKGIDKVFRSETELAFPGYRTQLFNPGDIDNVKKVQAGYKVQTLSAFLGTDRAEAAPAIDFIKPLYAGGAENVARVFQHPEFCSSVLPHSSFGDSTDGPFRQDRRRRGQDVRCRQALRPK